MLTVDQMRAVPNLLSPLPLEEETTWRKLLQIFRDDFGRGHGELFTPHQILIVDTIATRRYSRVQIIMPTQYGKSFSVADGVLLRVTTHKEKWAIIAPSEDKARIIMDYIIDRVFDDPLFSGLLEYTASKEKLKQERSKTRITFRGFGEVRVYSGNASNTRATKSALMGFGAPNIILDEAGQISDELYATVKRMVGGSEGTEAGSFLLEIGNPVMRNHFLRTWFGERYKKIFINDEVALAEGRYTEDFIAEMKDEAGYDWMYRCLFPDDDELLPNGYRRLVSSAVVDNAVVESMPELTYRTNASGERLKNQWGFDIIDDNPALGIDVAGGGANKTKMVIRLPKHNIAIVVKTMDTADLDIVADEAVHQIRTWTVEDWRTSVDAGGLGHGLPALISNKGHLVKAILFGEKDITAGSTVVFKTPKAFINIRAYMYWEIRRWLNDGGSILKDLGFMELKLINYRLNSSLRTQIEPKEDMIKRKAEQGEKVESPDTADALALTFVGSAADLDSDDDDDFFVD